MKARLTVALLAAVGIQSLAGQQKDAKRPAAPAHPNATQGNAGRGNAAKVNPPRPNPAQAPGIGNVRRLAEMTPQERQKALAALPADRREAVMKRLQAFQQMTPAERQRAEFELGRLQKLPQQKQNQVRRSIRQFTDLPEDRRAAIGPELDRLSAMPDEERRARMNSEEFRNRYSPAEQQMMSNIAEVLPHREEQ
jgi:hypothetical protein